MPSLLTICCAHAVSLNVFDGRQEKMILRLGVSEMPTVFCGPMMEKSSTCGGAVVPALAVPFEASDQSCGRIRSSYGPSDRRTNAPETFCWPALTRIGSVRNWSTPSGRSAELIERAALRSYL